MTSPSYPVALDALANPGPTTETDDVGFELDIVVSRLQNIAMALEQKLGIGSSTPPATAAVLRRTATGTSAWGQVVGGDVAGGGTANRVLATVDGATTAMQQIATGMIATGAVSQWQQQQWTPGASTTSTTAAGVSGSFTTIATTGGAVIILITGTITHNTALQYTGLQGALDGAGMGEFVLATTVTANGYIPFCIVHVASMAAGSHPIGALWRVSGGTASVAGGITTVMEIKK